MQKRHLLFLTNVKNTYSALLKFANQSPDGFDFLIHSADKENEHYSDLRNSRIIEDLIHDDSIIIFYLMGNLSLYVIDDFFKKNSNLIKKILFVFHSSDLFKLRNNSNYQTVQQTIKIIETKAENYLFVSALMTEDNYDTHFHKLDKKYFPHKNEVKNLVIPNENLIEEIIKLSSTNSKGKTIHLINEKYDAVKKAMEQIKFNPIEKLLDRIIYQEYFALSQFISQLPNLENITLINTNKESMDYKASANNHYSESTENSNELFFIK
jgi:hypothetical protein